MRRPKPKRTKDKALLKTLRLGHCELCGKADMGLQVHHVVSKGSGGPDHRCNLITLCADCHTRTHAGRIDRDALWRVVARRERMSSDEAEGAVRELTRHARIGADAAGVVRFWMRKQEGELSVLGGAAASGS